MDPISLRPLPVLPTLEEAEARLAAGLPPNFARFVADLLAHPDPDEQSYYGRLVPQPDEKSDPE